VPGWTRGNGAYRVQCFYRHHRDLAPRADRGAGSLVGAQFDEPNGVLALAAFSSIFKLTGAGAETAVGRLDPVLAEAGGAVALEARARFWKLRMVRSRLCAVGLSVNPSDMIRRSMQSGPALRKPPTWPGFRTIGIPPHTP